MDQNKKQPSPASTNLRLVPHLTLFDIRGTLNLIDSYYYYNLEHKVTFDVILNALDFEWCHQGLPFCVWRAYQSCSHCPRRHGRWIEFCIHMNSKLFFSFARLLELAKIQLLKSFFFSHPFHPDNSASCFCGFGMHRVHYFLMGILIKMNFQVLWRVLGISVKKRKNNNHVPY